MEEQVKIAGGAGLQVSVVHASQKILDDENRRWRLNKRDDSMVVATNQGKADAVVSAGPTGALMTASMRYLGTLPGIERPVMGDRSWDCRRRH